MLFSSVFQGIPVIFAEELEEKVEQTHTPLVMRITPMTRFNPE